MDFLGITFSLLRYVLDRIGRMISDAYNKTDTYHKLHLQWYHYEGW